MHKNSIPWRVALVGLGGAIVIAVPALAVSGSRPTDGEGATHTSVIVRSEIAPVVALQSDGRIEGVPLPAYPAPPGMITATPASEVDWVFGSASLEEIAASTLTRFIESGGAGPDTTVVRVRDFHPSDAPVFHGMPESVLRGSPIDVAITVKGAIEPMTSSGYGREPRTFPYGVIVVDRASGSAWKLSLFERYEQVPASFR